MAYLNRITLIGNLGKDPEIRVSQSGTKKASFSLATTERYKDRASGETKDATEWHNIVAWGSSAELLERLSLRKGVSIYIEGKQTNRSYDDPSGQKRYVSEVVMQSFQILTPRSSQGQGHSQGASQDAYSAPAGGYDEGYAQNQDDLPF